MTNNKNNSDFEQATYDADGKIVATGGTAPMKFFYDALGRVRRIEGSGFVTNLSWSTVNGGQVQIYAQASASSEGDQ